VKEYCAPVGCGTLHVVRRISIAFEYKQMTIYRTRYRDPKRHSWVNAWSPTHVVAELHRIEVEKRFAPRKVEIEVQRFEVNPGKYDIIKFLNEHAGE